MAVAVGVGDVGVVELSSRVRGRGRWGRGADVGVALDDHYQQECQ